ncbi:MAG: TIGR00730 family Rossman fold protein [Desulfobacterales bacterium]
MSKQRPRKTIFPSALEDARHAGLKAEADYLRSTSYRLAFQDPDFLLKDELRPVRLQLELLKPELALQEKGIESAVVVFGSARFLDPESAAARLESARIELSRDEGNPGLQASLKQAERAVAGSRYYSEARKLGNLIGRHSDNHRRVVMTGGGPGIMEAANRGAHEAGGLTIGMNIVLPHEQYPNPFITPELNFQFHYFAIRKMHLLMRAKCLVAFPGGFGTLDELFETLTLIQTGKIRRIPVLLFGRGFWQRVVDFQALVDEGTISPADLSLFQFVETAEEAWEIIRATGDGLDQ